MKREGRLHPEDRVEWKENLNEKVYSSVIAKRFRRFINWLYSLLINGEYFLNGGTNILVIENGEAYLSYANCPDHTCVRTGKIKYTGQSIVCLPNRLSVIVRSADREIDLIS